MTRHELPPTTESPSLFGTAPSSLPPASAAASSSAESMRMLPGLEVRFGAPPRRDAAAAKSRWNALVAALGIVAIGVAAYVWHARESAGVAPAALGLGADSKSGSGQVVPAGSVALASAESSKPAAAATQSVTAAPTTAAAAMTAAPTAAAAATTAAPERTAAVIEQIAPPASAKTTTTPARAETAPAELVIEVPPASAPAATARAPIVSARVVPPKTAATKERLAAAPAKTSNGAPVSSGSTSAGTRLASAAPATGPRSAEDSDVDLLAAMVAHLQGQGAATPPTASAKPAALAATRAEPPARTVAQRVRGCTRLGGKDGESCRRKVCKAYWGKDAACPMRLAPKRVIAANRPL